MNRVENIVDLPNEIIFLIFKYLLPSDRRVASECCRKFLDIWLHKKFIADRRLVLGDTTDNDSLLAILSTQRKYDHIVLSEKSDSFARNIRVDFLTKLGETVTKVELVGPYNACPDKNFWKLFPKLKVLIVKRMYLPEHLDQLPKSLELISLDGVGEAVLKRLSVEYLRKKSALINIELKNFEIDEVASFINEHQQNIIRFESSNTLLQSFKAQNLKHLLIKFRHGNERFLVNLEETFPHLQYLDLTIWTGLPLRNWMFLKKLTVSPKSDIEVKQLAMFENLEELVLYNYNNETDCFFVHEPFLNKNLKTLIATYYGALPCLDCFESMTKTFPNIEKLELIMNINNGHLKVLQENVPKLKSLKVETNAGATLSFEDFPNLSELFLSSAIIAEAKHWPLMPHLRTLYLWINEENVKIFEKTPALEHLLFDCHNKELEKLPAMVEKAVKHLKRLRNFKLTHHRSIQNLDIFKRDLKMILKKHSKYVKPIIISRHKYYHVLNDDRTSDYLYVSKENAIVPENVP